MYVSVVFSFYNEEKNIPELLKRLRSVFLPKYENNYELIFVNDNSSDNSLELLIEEGKKFGDIKILNMSRNFGVSECVMAGLEASSGDVVVYMDADLQDPPELITKMIDAYEE